MKITFLSNYYNHHQVALSKSLCNLTDKDFYFITSANVSESRKKLGYQEMNDDFVVAYNDHENHAQKLINESNLVICGSAPEEWIKIPKKQRGLIFRYSERPLKNGLELWKYPYRLLKWHKQNPRKAPIFMLCASAYTAADYAKFGLFKGKCFKWGYFPECKRYESVDDLMSKKIKNEILWCGRFLDWKHPDDVLKVAKLLKDDGAQFHINLIGTGEMEIELERMCEKFDLSEYVTFVGSVSSDKVREYMERASIYLFTSDRKEGWGAVLNEAMNSGCAVIASNVAGSTPYLVDNEKNGIVYQFGDIDFLYQSVSKLLNDTDLCYYFGKNAYETIISEWNAEVASERLVTLSERILSGEQKLDIFVSGPCSKA